MTQSEEILQELRELKNLLQIDAILRKEIINLEEAAQLLGVSKSTVYKYIGSRKLPFFRPSGKIIFLKKEYIYDFITANKYASREELVSGTLSNADKSLKKLNGTNC
jgi:excisionase family DNA binding protein